MNRVLSLYPRLSTMTRGSESISPVVRSLLFALATHSKPLNSPDHDVLRSYEKYLFYCYLISKIKILDTDRSTRKKCRKSYKCFNWSIFNRHGYPYFDTSWFSVQRRSEFTCSRKIYGCCEYIFFNLHA